MTTPTPEATEAAAREMFSIYEPINNWEEASQAHKDGYMYRALRTLAVAAPFIAAQAKAEAWDAVIARIDLGAPFMVDEKYTAGANWVRGQIEDVLKPTIEGKSE